MPLRMKDLLTFAQSFALWRGGMARVPNQARYPVHVTSGMDANPYIKLRFAAWCGKGNGSGSCSATGTSVSSPKLYRGDEHSGSEEWHAECYGQGGLVGVV